MQKEFGTDGKGFYMGTEKITARYGADGIRIAYGTSVERSYRNLLLTWEQAAIRIRELLDTGQFMPQEEIDRVAEWERKDLAERLWYIYRDEFEKIPNEQKVIILEPTYPESVAKITERLKDLREVEEIADNIEKCTGLMAEHPPRWKNHRDPRIVKEAVSDLLRVPLVFRAQKNFTFAERKKFISDDEIDKMLTRGGNISEGKFRIYVYFKNNHTAKEKADFLREEYGIGGYGDSTDNVWHDSKGLSYSRGTIGEPYDKVLLKWNQVVSRTDRLISEGRFLSEKELAYFPEYEKQLLCRSIYGFFRNQPEEVPKPYPHGAEYEKGVSAIRLRISSQAEVQSILSTMQEVLNNTAPFDRHYDSMRKAFEDLTAYDNGTYALIGERNESPYPVQQEQQPMQAEQEMEQAEEIGKRFIVEQRRNGENDTVYSIYDDIQSDVYAENDMVLTFSDRKEAQTFADKLNEKTEQAIQKLSGEYIEEDGLLFQIETVDGHLKEDFAYLIEVLRAGADREAKHRVYTMEYLLSLIEEDGRKLTPNVEAYQKLQEEYPNHIIGVNVGDRLLFYGKDAEIAAKLLNQRLLHRNIEDMGETSITGYEYGQWVSVGKRLIQHGHSFVFAKPTDSGDYQIVKELTAEKIPVGKELEIDGRKFVVDSVNYDAGSVSLQDVTFQNSTGFPIFRNETIDFVRSHIEEQEQSVSLSIPVSVDSEKTSAEIDSAALRQAKEEVRNRVFPSEIILQPLKTTPDPRNYRITNDALGVGGAKEKCRNNLEAIRTLRYIEDEKRLATVGEQEILSKYVGWGGLPQTFDENNSSWANEYRELQGLLAPAEYVSARGSVLNAHYTSPVVIRAIYQAIENMGFRKGNILEPACGIGNFFGMLPESMQESKLYGVELDSITGRIAKQLYQKNNIAVCGFEETNLPDSFFDVAVGNVPFGSYKVSDRKYDKYNFLIHDFFFAKTIDKVRSGGIIAFITSKGTMDKKNPSVRKYIAQRADLLGAIRLPNNAFKANAGTEVTSDILFLQKRDRIVDIEPDWVHLGQNENGIPINQYFLDHPEMVLGEMAFDDRLYGSEKETTCNPYEGKDLGELLSAAIENIHGEIEAYEFDEILDEEQDQSIPADPNIRNFSYAVVDGKIYYRENSVMIPANVSATAESRIRGMIAIRDSVRKLIEYQTEDYPDNDILAEQKILNRLYDDFSKQYGLLNSRGNSMAFSQDSSYPLLCSLEILDEHGNLKRKADMFTKRTIKQNTRVDRVDTASEALAVSLGEKACVDMVLMSYLTGRSEDELYQELQGVIFLNPLYVYGSHAEQKYLTAEEY